MAGFLDNLKQVVGGQGGAEVSGEPTSDELRHHYDRPLERTAERGCSPQKIDLQLKLPGLKRCYTQAELATEIVQNILTHGASGGSKIVGGLLDSGGMGDRNTRTALSVALGNTSVQSALMREATSNPDAVIHFTRQLSSVDFRGSGGPQVQTFVSGLADVAGRTLSTVVEVGGQAVRGAAGLAGRAADGIGSALNSVGEAIEKQVGPATPPKQQSSFGNK